MSEAEILDGFFSAIEAVMTIFSMFFALVSGYLAALYLFLNRAPALLKLVAFGLLSIGLLFLGGTAATVQKIQDGLFASWARLPAPMLDIMELRNPVDLKLELGLTLQEIGVGMGWGTALAVYLALGYMTFCYRWPRGERD